MKKYNHAYMIAFECISEHPEGEDVTPRMLCAALLRRCADLSQSRPDQGEWIEATGQPYDTYEIEEAQQ